MHQTVVQARKGRTGGRDKANTSRDLACQVPKWFTMSATIPPTAINEATGQHDHETSQLSQQFLKVNGNSDMPNTNSINGSTHRLNGGLGYQMAPQLQEFGPPTDSPNDHRSHTVREVIVEDNDASSRNMEVSGKERAETGPGAVKGPNANDGKCRSIKSGSKKQIKSKT